MFYNRPEIEPGHSPVKAWSPNSRSSGNSLNIFQLFHFISFVGLLGITLCLALLVVGLEFVVYIFNLSSLPSSDIIPHHI